MRLWLRLFPRKDGCRVPLQSTLSNPVPLVGNQTKLKATVPCENKVCSWMEHFLSIFSQEVKTREEVDEWGPYTSKVSKDLNQNF